MNQKSKTIKNIIAVTLSNLTTIVSGVLIGFLLPKIFSIADYGFYKTFTLYTNYLGLISIGIIDGIVLEYGNYDYEQLDSYKFRGFFKWYLFVHVTACVLILCASIFFNDSDYTFIIIALAINAISVNVTGYYQQISQITQRFRELSIRKVLQSISNILLVLILFFVSIKYEVVNYKIYIIFYILICSLLTLWYFYTYRKITFGKGATLKETKSDVFHLIKIGFPLMFANLCSTLILTLDRQFVNILFPNNEYAVYAFAYNMLSLVTIVTSAISTVIYPILKRTTKETLVKNYSSLISIMHIFVFGALVVYFPLKVFITWFLPNYIGAINIFRIIFPGLAISSSITVIMHNYYKTLGKNNNYFKKSIVILIISAIANGIAYLIFKTTVSISIASIIVMIIWYLYVEHFFVKEYNYSRWRNLVYMILTIILFYLVTFIENPIISGLIYFVLYSLLTIVMHKNSLKTAKEILKK